MAATVNLQELRDRLRSPDDIQSDPFGLLKEIAGAVNDERRRLQGTELVLRALEHRTAFGNARPILESLVRELGLFPYVDTELQSLSELIAYEYHRPLDNEDTVFHRVQAEVFRRLVAGENVILSAPTSFGKSRIIDAVIESRGFTTAAIVVPTLALIDETRRRLAQRFSNRYKIVTHTSQTPGDRTIFVLTAERAVAYDNLPSIEFFVIDEFYKIGAVAEDDQSRVVALNQAFYRLFKMEGQFYLLGPNIERVPDPVEESLRCTFLRTTAATVVTEQHRIRVKDGESLPRLVDLAKTLDGPTLIYCASPRSATTVARALLAAKVGNPTRSLDSAADWIADTYSPDWILPSGLPQGIGIHHGRLPRSLGQFVVRAFNREQLSFLVCTSTLIEGVNTSAKNVVIYDNTIAARRNLDFFTFNNIRGRSGRMFQHFIGRVYLFADPPDPELPFVDFPFLTQGESAPDSLLVQIDDDDLSSHADSRMDEIRDQEFLSLEVIRRNAGVDPHQQIALAKLIRSNARRWQGLLSWRSYPKWDQLKFVCNLIWGHLTSRRRRGGVASGVQLAFKVNDLSKKRSYRERIESELTGRFGADSTDAAVDRILDFERTWATFEFPRLLVAVSGIQSDVYSQLGQRGGDFRYYARQVESLFANPILVSLDEFGVAFPVAQSLNQYFRGVSELDEALDVLRSLNLDRLSLHQFERELAAECQAGI